MSKDLKRFGEVHGNYKGQVVVPYTTQRIDQGGYFLGTDVNSVVSGGVTDYLIQTPTDAVVYLSITVLMQNGPGVCQFLRQPTGTPSSNVSSIDMNRDINSGFGLVPRTLIRKTLFDGVGLLLFSDMAAGGERTGVFKGEVGDQFKLNNNFLYGFRIQNFSEGASLFSVQFHFSEFRE